MLRLQLVRRFVSMARVSIPRVDPCLIRLGNGHEPLSMRHTRILLAATASLLLITACSSDDPSATDTTPAPTEATADAATTDPPAADDAAGAGAQVGLKASRFDPTVVEVAVGESVTFTNNDPFNHTITSKDDSPIEYDSGNLGDGETFEQTYDEAGTYAFFCKIHPTMRGTVTVG